MSHFFHHHPGDSQPRTIVIARFKTPEDAADCKEFINTRFEEIQSRVDELYLDQNGVARASDLAKIYTEFGFTNDVGWEQDIPIVAKEKDIAWALPPGALLDDAENLLMTLSPVDIQSYEDSTQLEDWQMFHHPAMMPLPDEAAISEMDDYSDETAPPSKRLLH